MATRPPSKRTKHDALTLEGAGKEIIVKNSAREDNSIYSLRDFVWYMYDYAIKVDKWHMTYAITVTMCLLKKSLIC
jgi:hypothetical protein